MSSVDGSKNGNTHKRPSTVICVAGHWLCMHEMNAGLLIDWPDRFNQSATLAWTTNVLTDFGSARRHQNRDSCASPWTRRRTVHDTCRACESPTAQQDFGRNHLWITFCFCVVEIVFGRSGPNRQRFHGCQRGKKVCPECEAARAYSDGENKQGLALGKNNYQNPVFRSPCRHSLTGTLFALFANQGASPCVLRSVTVLWSGCGVVLSA